MNESKLTVKPSYGFEPIAIYAAYREALDRAIVAEKRLHRAEEIIKEQEAALLAMWHQPTTGGQK